MENDVSVPAIPIQGNSSVVKPVRLLIVGSFDLFHFGHVRAFKRAKELFPNGELVVGGPLNESAPNQPLFGPAVARSHSHDFC